MSEAAKILVVDDLLGFERYMWLAMLAAAHKHGEVVALEAKPPEAKPGDWAQHLLVTRTLFPKPERRARLAREGIAAMMGRLQERRSA